MADDFTRAASHMEGIARDLGTAGQRVEGLSKLSVAKIGHDVVRDAQAVVRVDTGNLKNSISVDIDPDGLGFEAGPTAGYGHFLEFGTIHMPPYPYMIPAWRRQTASLDEVAQAIAGQVFP